MIAGLFEVIAADESQVRLANRKALVLAETRLEKTVGQFLAASKSYEEFDTRYSLVSDEFSGIVQGACDEIGVDSDDIAKTLHTRYRNVACKSDFDPSNWSDEERDEREDEIDDDSKKSSVHEARKPRMCPYHNEIVDIALATGNPQSGFETMQSHAWGDNHCQGTWDGGKCKFKAQMVNQSYWDERQQQLDERREQRQEMGLDNVVDFPSDEQGDADTNDHIDLDNAEVIDFPSEGGGASVADSVDVAPLAVAESKTAEYYPGQQGNSAEELAYLDSEQPINYDDGSLEGDHYLGRHQQQPHPECPDCQNPAGSSTWVHENGESFHPAYGRAAEKGKFPFHKNKPDKGDSPEDEEEVEKKDEESDDAPLDFEARVAGGADDKDSSDQESVDLPSGKNDSGLDGPSPKIDKGDARKKGDTGWSLDEIDVPSKRNPTERKDVTVPMDRKNITDSVKDSVKEIGEQTSETQDLPAATGDEAGFAGPNQEQAPHTDTWGNDGQTTPVTNDTLEKAASLRWGHIVEADVFRQPQERFPGPEQHAAEGICPACERGEIVGGICNYCQTPHQHGLRTEWGPEQVAPHLDPYAGPEAGDPRDLTR